MILEERQELSSGVTSSGPGLKPFLVPGRTLPEGIRRPWDLERVLAHNGAGLEAVTGEPG